MVAIKGSFTSFLGRIFKGPNITFFTMLGMCVMILGAIVCIFAPKINEKLTHRPQDEMSSVPVKLAGLAIVTVGLIITIYLKG